MRLLPYAACAAPLALYQALYFSGYYPITEGWFSEYARLIREGQVPYRDFPLLLPPLYPLQIAGFQMLFGEGIFALRLFGIFITCGIALALLDLLRNFFNPWICAFAAAVATIYYQSGVAYFGYDFTQFVTLYLLIAAALLVRSIKVASVDGSEYWLSGWAGFFLGLAVLIKQSNAALAALVLIAGSIVVGVALYKLRVAVARNAALIVGLCVPVAAMMAWLVATGATESFFADVFTHAASAKGGIGVSLFAWFWHFFTDPPGFWFFLDQMAGKLAALFFGILLVSAALETAVALEERRPFDLRALTAPLRRIVGIAPSAPPGRAALVSIVALGLLAATILAVARSGCTDCTSLISGEIVPSRPVGVLLQQLESSWSVTFYLVGFVLSGIALLRSPDASVARLFIVITLGVGLTFGNGTSGGISEISTFLGVGILLAMLMQAWVRYIIPVFLPVAAALYFCAFYVQNKFDVPYSWWLLNSPPVRSSDCAQAEGILQDLCMPPEEYAAITRIDNAITANSSPRDAIYVYPHMPIFYLMTNRAPYDSAVVSWFDFMTDDFAKDVAERLRIQPPPVIIKAEVPEIVMTAHEAAFRGGRALGQRQILLSIADLQSGGTLQRIDRENISGVMIDVYKRSPPKPRKAAK